MRTGARALIMGTMWLMREIELAALRKGDVVVGEGRGCGTVTINLDTGNPIPARRGPTEHWHAQAPRCRAQSRQLKRYWLSSRGCGMTSCLHATWQGSQSRRPRWCESYRIMRGRVAQKGASRGTV